MHKKGKFLMGLGLLLVAGALSLTLYNKYLENAARKNSDSVLMQMAEIPLQESPKDPEYIPDYVIDPTRPMPTVELDGHHYCGSLSIPALGLSFPIMSEWNYTKLTIAPCVYVGTCYGPGFVIMAHNYNTHFGPIKNLEVGDEVTFRDLDYNVFHYVVEDTEELRATQIEDMIDSGYDLTLFTCTPGGAARVTVRLTLTDTERLSVSE